jgi:hypothetical protein
VARRSRATIAPSRAVTVYPPAVGDTIACAGRVNGEDDEGTALLETDEVIFRGKRARVKVPFASIRSLAVKGAWLAIVHAGGSLDLAVGKRARAWTDKIRKPKGIVEKLGVKPGARVAFVAWKDADVAAGLEAAGARVLEGMPRAEVDVVILGVKSEAELAKIGAVTKKLARDGALWIVRPKGKDGVAEAAVMSAGKRAGLVDVKVARYSETHTAEKFVIPLARR